MRNYFFLIALLGLFPLSLFAVDVGSRIDMGVSPLKYELTAVPGKPNTRTITFFNNSNNPYNIFLSAEDCTADSTSGTPKCRPPVGSGTNIESVSTWITFQDASRFVVPPKSERKINFTITAPDGAIPGGHYGAIFLNNLDDSAESGNAVKMIRRAGVLLLVNVPGKLVYDTKIGDIEIDIPLFSAPDEADRPSIPKWKTWTNRVIEELDPRINTPILLDDGDFVVTFTVAVNNAGNIHILPVGRIELFDEKGLLLKKIGKESIRTPEGVFIGEKIVDYLPINDETSNVLPNSDRVFRVTWRGFAYEAVEGGKMAIKYLSPQDYYAQLETKNAEVLMPWEKYRVKLVEKTLKAKINLEYKGENDVLVPYEREEDVVIKYYSLERGINYGALAIILIIILLFWIISRYRNREKRMEKLEEEVEYLEEEIDELEKGRVMAKKALEKKATKKPAPKKSPEKKSTSRKTPPKE